MMEVLVKDCIMPTLYNSASAQDRLETVNLDSALGNALLGEELRNLYTLITLELDDLSELLIVHDRPVTGEVLEVSRALVCKNFVAILGRYHNPDSPS